ncbi:MAG: KpsF/GutQ family sugar-phosphate isomerase [Planctomycetota bacterium]
MSRHAAARSSRQDVDLNAAHILDRGRAVMANEARGIGEAARRLDGRFVAAVRMISAAPGSLFVVGMGKAGLIGQKLAATFCSTGTRAHFLHPAEAFHGDLGRIQIDDVALLLSHSGETAEVLQLLPSLREFGVPVIAVTAVEQCSLGRAASIVLPLGRLEEACRWGLAPSTSTSAMLAIGDALALTASEVNGFSDADFARFHPGGSLGLKLSAVDDHMRTVEECRTAWDQRTVRDVLVASTKPGRRSGAVMLTDAEGRLTGLFTDSDLARIFERCDEAALDQPIGELMAKAPTTVTTGQRMAVAIELLADRKFSELPVVDCQGRPVGLIDVTDVVGMLPDPGRRSKIGADATSGGRLPTVRIFPSCDAEPSTGDRRRLPPTDEPV